MDDDFDDAAFAAVADAAERKSAASGSASSRQQASSTTGKVQQPKPQALPSRSGPSSVLVSPRQKGNPILNSIKAMPWEYSDIPADYVLGTTTCALFLSLKYHRLHPEYIYARIRNLQGRYNLRIMLTMVDIQNHEESIKELSKTSLINNVTIVLCWSAQEAGRYLELYKQYEHAAPTSIKAHQATGYADRMTEFVTTPRSINKTDAVSLVSSFGSLRTAINARPEEISLIAGWGEKKVQRWCTSVREPFRVRKAARRGIGRELSTASIGAGTPEASGDNVRAESEMDPGVAVRLGIGSPAPIGRTPSRPGTAANTVPDADRRPSTRLAEGSTLRGPDEDEEEAMMDSAMQGLPNEKHMQPLSKSGVSDGSRPKDDQPSEGVMAALSRLRNQ
ncbi:MAG: ssDNA endonuclease and repair protein rad10 [Bathelium mastoideum]|nr:MAG: ssDNA endonuclease and repair protein rad10 [Bathelium mastoideum]KAI9691841.1 MAG: ssDNA endonuclease and repair protein rad10 [Bathelium mastoideum]